MQLKYGMNPNQDFAEVTAPNNSFEVLNGKPSVINVLDALNSWQLVKEASECLHKKVATSFKHVTPSGVGVGSVLSEKEKQAYLVKIEASELASSYIKARGVDRLASFGDFIALSSEIDVETARIIKSEVSDGIIAPAYKPEALNILKEKKKGNYVIFQIDAAYTPPEIESREIFGITIRQKRNDLKITKDFLKNVVTKTNQLSDSVIDDLLLGMITLKYTQSNSLCAVYKGQVIGIGSGQQSRILCSGLALSKANVWHQKQQLDYSFLDNMKGLKRTDTDQIIEQEREKQFGNKIMLNELDGVCLISDGFFPQKDNIELAYQYGVKFIASPMGSIRDQEIIDTADKYGITFINTGVRLFHH
ncbi:MAG: 5-aminoimidazole-4-carboxamide ribonucleotide transformylase [Prolixibacteraceae bacterium]|nr:5-aminoimidazole-4-carboxamide ribonucleotide transformylase [Prolixibacteraceae bacterium]MBN2649001.1 5-aminoimidazole-4-carboxamide ribonucleotide transformylase [Prolixibacteraceae bacterium]